MNCRRHGRKPTLALWMLVAIADLAILATAAGALVMLSIFATVAVLAGGVVAARLVTRRPEPARTGRRA
nr:hypothetical protein [uncultured Actinoplanes sp.]